VESGDERIKIKQQPAESEVKANEMVSSPDRIAGDSETVPVEDQEGGASDHPQLDGSDAEDSDIQQSDDNGSIAEDIDGEGSDIDGSEVEDSALEDFDYQEIINNVDFEDFIAMMTESELEQFLVEIGEKDSYVGGPTLEPTDDSSDWHVYDPHHATDVFPYNIERPAAGFQTFTLFPKLPIEIRGMIWRATFRPRRHVWSYEDGLDTCCKRVGLTHPPIALFVNKESREKALKSYKRLERS
jgi:2EXR family